MDCLNLSLVLLDITEAMLLNQKINSHGLTGFKLYLTVNTGLLTSSDHVIVQIW